MAKQLTSLAKNAKGLGDYAGTAVNTSIVLVTTGLEQLTTLATYRCPCVDPTQISGCNHTIGKNVCNTQLLNYGYGLVFIIAPAIGLLVFGLVSNPRMWKSLTGVCRKTEELKRGFVECGWTFVGIAGQAFIAPITWVTIAMLDGRYYACAITALPYDTVGAGATPTYANCEKVAQAKVPITSNLYNSNRSYSQVLGWIILASGIVLGMILYAYTQCNSPLTYYHAKYFQLYRSAEEAEFDDEMKKKAQKDAECNVLQFMEKRRSKTEWDQISTVYEFHRDKKNLALYSHLHEWVLNQQKKSLLRKQGGEKQPLIDGKDHEDGEDRGGDVNNITVVANVINT